MMYQMRKRLNAVMPAIFCLVAFLVTPGMAQSSCVFTPLSPPGKVYPLFDWRMTNDGSLPQSFTYELEEDSIRMTIADGTNAGVDPNQVRIVLTSAAGITWRKEIVAWNEHQGQTLVVASQDNNHGPISMTLSPRTCSGGADTIIFRKLKFGRGMIDMYHLDLKFFWPMLRGKVVTFNWFGDDCNICFTYPMACSSPCIPVSTDPSQYVIKPAAVSWGPGRIDLFGLGVDNSLFHKACGGPQCDGTQWSSWESLGGILTSGPAVCSWGNNRLGVFARGLNNGLWHNVWDGSRWSGWFPLGEVLTSDPAAVSWGPTRIDVFWRGTNNILQHKAYEHGYGWSIMEELGQDLTSGPAVASSGSNRLDVFVRRSDNTLYRRSYNGYGSGWDNWTQLGDVLTSDPGAVSWGPGRIDLVWRGPSNTLRHRYAVNDMWQYPWDDQGGGLAPLGQASVPSPAAPGPTVSSWGPERLDIFVQGLNGAIFRKKFDRRWFPWETIQ